LDPVEQPVATHLPGGAPWMSEAPVLIDGDFGEGAYAPTILLTLRSTEAADLLLSIFGDLVDSAPGTEIRLDWVPGVSLGASIMRFVLRAVDVSPERHLVRDDAGGFLWSCTAEEWDTARLLVEPLRCQPGHQYLTSEIEDDALVEVSAG
jgi:hypothetical protein